MNLNFIAEKKHIKSMSLLSLFLKIIDLHCYFDGTTFPFNETEQISFLDSKVIIILMNWIYFISPHLPFPLPTEITSLCF